MEKALGNRPGSGHSIRIADKASPLLLLWAVAVTCGSLAQSVPQSAPPPNPNITAPGPQRHSPQTQRQSMPAGAVAPQPIRQIVGNGTIEGFVYWDTSAISHVPAGDCSGLAVNVAIGESATGPYTSLATLSDNFKYVGQVKQSLVGGKIKVYDVCTYGYGKLPVGPNFRVTINVTSPTAFSPLSAPQNSIISPVNIINAQCNMLPRIVNPTASDLFSKWGTCQNMAFDVNFEITKAAQSLSSNGGVQRGTTGAQGSNGPGPVGTTLLTGSGKTTLLNGTGSPASSTQSGGAGAQSQPSSGMLLGNNVQGNSGSNNATRQTYTGPTRGSSPGSKVELNPQPYPPKQVLTNHDVLSMLNAQLAESVILHSLRFSQHKFDFSAESCRDLQRARVTAPILNAMGDGSVRPCPELTVPGALPGAADSANGSRQAITDITNRGASGVVPGRITGGIGSSSSPQPQRPVNPGVLPSPVHIVRPGVGTTAFDPRIHGFRFVNDFLNDVVPSVDVRTGGLCGGMSYSALDYYFARVPIPQQSYRPANRTTLQSYLYNREVDSLASNLDKWAEVGFNPGGARNGEFFNWGLQGTNGGRLEELRSFIDQGIPAVIDLQGDGGTGNHQIVAIGYNMGRYEGDLGNFESDLKIIVYDPNYPMKVRTLVPDVPNQIYRYAEGGTERWRTYFVDKNYHAKTPPNLPNPVYPNDGTVRELILSFHTGTDDLRGGNDNIDLTLDLLDGSRQQYPNINLSARWLPNYTESARIILSTPIRPDQIRDLVLTDTFGGGMGGDNWDMASVSIGLLVNGKIVLVMTSGFHRFSADSSGAKARMLTIGLN